jgi:hypothetical protein
VANASRHLSGALVSALNRGFSSNGFRITSLRVRIVRSVLSTSDHGTSRFLCGEFDTDGDPARLTDLAFTCTPASHTTQRRGAAVAAPDKRLWKKRSATAVTPSRRTWHRSFSSGPSNGGVTGATTSWAAATGVGRGELAVIYCMQRYVSNELTHFVGRSLRADEEAQYQLLLKICRSGTLLDPRYLGKRDTPIFFFNVVDRDGSERRQQYFPEPYFEVRINGPVEANEFVAPEMVCFCDIPLLELEIHTSKYSRFGLAFHKAFLVRQGASPVHYVAREAATPLRLVGRDGVHADFFEPDEEHGLLSAGQERSKFLEQLKTRTFDLIERYSAPLQEKLGAYQRGKDDPRKLRAELLAMVEFMMGTFCYLHGQVKVFDSTLGDGDPNNFYMEREWRVIGRVMFNAGDVARVIVPEGFGGRFRTDEPGFRGEVTEL